MYAHFEREHHFMLWKEDIRKGSKLQEKLLRYQYQWDSIQDIQVVWPIFRLSDKKYFTDQAWRPPFSIDGNRFHLLGTFELGRDVFVSTLFGLQKSLLISIISVFIALLIGLPIGVAFSYLGIERPKLNLLQLTTMIFLGIIIFYLILVSIDMHTIGYEAILLISLFLIWIIAVNSSTSKWVIRINPDFILMRWIELVKSLPIILILLILLQLVHKPDFFTISLLIGMILSVTIAKYSRFITLSESKQSYILNLKALGYSPQKIIIFHLIPKVFSSIQPLIYLSLGTVILVEASISFLGLGLPVEEVSLGGMMYTARTYPNAWWIVLFPGLCVYWLVYCFQTIHQEQQYDKLSF